ncbi:uncharacterized protein LOC129579481 [Sitodiplosis mosellana]|uniref:uncharacterized protein LOC129579481 n=1 Tax=Sitodiplosis mosellana TaxID=263140 RepID=UPI002443872E|nr:uncharacterized protein LOC129579481 [Sitodiplosis mosellana]
MDTIYNLKFLTLLTRFSVCFLGCSLIYYTYRYWIRGERYTKDAESPDKVAIVTGASKGIGKEVAYGLAKRGLHVIMACYDMKSGLQTQDEIIKKTGNTNVKCMHLDLSSFKSIRSFADEFLNSGSRLDILINNANVFHMKRRLTENHIEKNIAINYFGHFLLTLLLIKRMSQTVPTRVINVTNWVHRCVEIDPTDLLNQRQFCGFMAYARSTLANVFFTLALTERIENTGITCNCIHPGISLTSVIDRQSSESTWFQPKLLAKFLSNILCKSDRACADTIIFAAIDISVQNLSGIYLSDCQIGQPGANVNNRNIAEWLWKKSEEITGETLCDLPNNFKFLKKIIKSFDELMHGRERDKTTAILQKNLNTHVESYTAVAVAAVTGEKEKQRTAHFYQVHQRSARSNMNTSKLSGVLNFARKWIQGGQFYSNVRIDGKVVIVTGCNTGIGRETVLDLAGRGAHIHMACRDYKRCEITRQEIIAKTGNHNVFNRELDLSSMDSIRKFVAKFLQEEKRLDILINNAGVMAMPKALTKDGFEMQLGVNHLGHFLLTNLLLDILKSSAPSRIIVLSSLAHKYGEINRNDLNSEKSYNKYNAYSQSKLSNILFTQELAKRLKGTGVTVNCVHPGIVKTDLGRHLVHSYIKKLIDPFTYYFFKTAKSGAQTSIRLAVDPELDKVTGQYFADCRMQKVAASARKNNNDAEWLWQASEKMTRLSSHTHPV